MKRALGFAIALLVLAPLNVLAQTPTYVIQGQKGSTRIRLHCESMTASGDREARTFSVQADEVLAHDLDWAGVFVITKSWAQGQQPFDVAGIVGGTFSVRGNQVRLQGEVRDFPARRPILVKEYRGSLQDWRSLVHRFADDVVLQFTGEPGVSQTKIAYVAQEGRTKELYVMDWDGANVRQLTADKSIALSPSWSPDGSLLLFTSYRGVTRQPST
jgi:TolB protein